MSLFGLINRGLGPMGSFPFRPDRHGHHPTYDPIYDPTHDPTYDPLMTPFMTLSKMTPHGNVVSGVAGGIRDVVVEAAWTTIAYAERHDAPRNLDPSDLTRRFKVVDAALDNLIQISCRYLLSNGQRFGTQPGKLVVDQAKS